MKRFLLTPGLVALLFVVSATAAFADHPISVVSHNLGCSGGPIQVSVGTGSGSAPWRLQLVVRDASATTTLRSIFPLATIDVPFNGTVNASYATLDRGDYTFRVRLWSTAGGLFFHSETDFLPFSCAPATHGYLSVLVADGERGLNLVKVRAEGGPSVWTWYNTWVDWEGTVMHSPGYTLLYLPEADGHHLWLCMGTPTGDMTAMAVGPYEVRAAQTTSVALDVNDLEWTLAGGNGCDDWQ